MARGTVVGEPVVSQAQTDAGREGYARIFGDRKPQRGRWIFDTRVGSLVEASEYIPPSSDARDAPIMTGACHEGQVAPDGTDISSRAKRAAWMRESGCADYDDFKGARERRAKELAEARRVVETGKVEKHDPNLRDFIGRELYKRKIIL